MEEGRWEWESDKGRKGGMEKGAKRRHRKSKRGTDMKKIKF